MLENLIGQKMKVYFCPDNRIVVGCKSISHCKKWEHRNWSVVGTIIFVSSFEDWGNPCSFPVVGKDTFGH